MKATFSMMALMIGVFTLLAAPILEAQDFDRKDLERRIRDRLEKDGKADHQNDRQNDHQNDQQHAEHSSSNGSKESEKPDEVLHQRHADGHHDRDIVEGVHKGYARHHLAGIRAGVKRADFQHVPKELSSGHRDLPKGLDRDKITTER